MSLRLKLTLGYALIFSLSALIFSLGVYLVVRDQLQSSLDADLKRVAALARTKVTVQNGTAHFAASFKTPHDIAAELLDGQGRPLALVGDLDDGAAQWLPLRTGFSSTSDRRVYVARLPQGFLRLSQPSNALTEVFETLGRVMLLGALFLVLVACVAGYWLADRALRPVDVVARTARRIAREGAYRERVPAAPGGDEMARLTLTVNEMLDRLEATIEREKSFARTAAHELRTPLTALKGRLELALERPREAADYQRSLQRMLQRVEDLITLSEALLALARTERPAQLEAVELAALALEAAEPFGDRVQLRLEVEESWVQAEAVGLRQLLVNLLDNALKYGQAPVLLGVRAGALWVQDAGRGPPAGEWERLTRPFERGAGSQGQPGSGLGLALVAALVTRWNAQLRPHWLPEGFAVEVRWKGNGAGRPKAATLAS